MKVMLLFFEDGDEDAFLKVQRLIQLDPHLESLDFKNQLPSSIFEILESQRRVFCQGREIPLTKTEYEILLYLFQNANCVLTYSQIYEKVW
jgi:DNA-binding response OmpR family regulator